MVVSQKAPLTTNYIEAAQKQASPSQPKNLEPTSEDKLKLKTLHDCLCLRLDDLFSELKIDLKQIGNEYVGQCPIHGGDNKTALKVYGSGHTTLGNWACFTRECQKCFPSNLIGLTHGIFSHRKGWSKPGDRKSSFWEAVRWLCDFLGQKYETLTFDVKSAEKKGFARQVQALREKTDKPSGWSPMEVRNRLIIPSPYFLGRHLTAETLRSWDVGDSLTKDISSPMYGRAVVPVFDNEGKRVIGCTGRSLFPHCNICDSWHPAGKCPPNPEAASYRKWRHTPGLNTGSSLFGYWKASKAIFDTRTAVLVEGPADVMRLHQAGVKNCVGLYGIKIDDGQQVALEISGAMTILVLPDGDLGGDSMAANVEAKLSKLFRVKVLKSPTTDPDEMSDEQVKAIFNV